MMIVYPLDSDFKESGVVIDDYESLIWTERFSDYGDFELHIRPDKGGTTRLSVGTVLSIRESNRLMVVTTEEHKPLENGGSMVKFSGKSIESVLDLRVADQTYQTSWAGLLYGALQRSFSGAYGASDKLGTIKRDENEFYPASSLPPSLSTPDAARWNQLSDLYSSARDNHPLGFRIVRDPQTAQLYYETYTGNDRSAAGRFRTNNKTLLQSNPDMFESDDSVRVWTNLAQNPGFVDKQMLLYYNVGSEMSAGGNAVLTIEDDPYSVSGKCMRLFSDPNGSNSESVAYIMSTGTPLADYWDNKQFFGRTVTFQVTVNVPAVQYGGWRAGCVRGMQLYGSTTKGALGTSRQVVQAPNTVGRHRLTMTVTLPASGGAYSHWTLILVNGSSDSRDSVEFSDFVAIDGPSNPVGYFDYGYSPDPDLTPATIIDPRGFPLGALFGSKVKGYDAVGCAFVLSNNWDKANGGVSGRMIKNQNLAYHHAASTMGQFANARLVKFKQYQSGILASPGAMFGAVDLYRAGTKIVAGTAKPNTIGEREATVTSTSDIDEVVLRGAHATFGGSLYWDKVLVAPTTGFSEIMNDVVIFSEALDTFVVSESKKSIDGYYNVAYVTRGDTVLEIDSGMARDGLMRRVIHVDGSDLDPVHGNIQDQMVALGKAALDSRRSTSLIDGSVPPYSRYLYDVDYYLGDLVSVQDEFGKTVPARVAEQIFVQDAEGYKTYPTLREETSDVLGNWTSPEYNIIWNNAEPLGTWFDQP